MRQRALAQPRSGPCRPTGRARLARPRSAVRPRSARAARRPPDRAARQRLGGGRRPSPLGALGRWRAIARHAPWHFLNFLPDPHQHGSLRPSCSDLVDPALLDRRARGSAHPARRRPPAPRAARPPPPSPARRLRRPAARVADARAARSPSSTRGSAAAVRRCGGGATGSGGRPSTVTSTWKIIRAKSPQIAVHQVAEQRERLVLVGDQRLDLGEPAQVDPLRR